MITIARFATYNTSDANVGSAQLAASASITPLVLQTPFSTTVGGSVASDQAGTLTAAQSFDGTNWDGPVTPITVVGGTPQSFSFTVLAPFVQISYTNTGGSTTTYLRIFARAFGSRSGG